MTKYKKTLIGFERVDNQPLEKNVVFATTAELTAYLQNDPTKYNGQVVTVSGNGTSSKGTSYRIDRLGSTWKAVPLADSEDVATKAQGTKADSAVQDATVGGTAVTKSGTTLQFPAYPTTLPASDKNAILSAAATDAQNKVNAHAGDTTKHITAAERTKWNTAIQGATIGGTAVSESANILQLPAYPTTLPASDKATILSEAATTAQSKVDAAIKTNVTDKKGVANGLATLDGSGKVPSHQLPSYVDDVKTLKGFDIPTTASGFVSGDLMYKTSDKKIYVFAASTWGILGDPESDKIYINEVGNKTYRWSGSDMVVISETIALGTTSSTAYPGNLGAANATNITALQSGKLDKTGDGSNVTSAFTIASSRANIASGEKLSVMFGKVAKWFGDLKALAFKATVGSDDIDNRAITSNKLDYALANSVEYSRVFFEYNTLRINVFTADSASVNGTSLYSDSRFWSGRKIRVSGVKKYISVDMEEVYTGIMAGTTIFIEDESGNDITSMFEKTSPSSGEISLKLTALVDIGTISISINNIEYNAG